MTSFAAANSFHSYLVSASCSDRTVRVLDLNAQSVGLTLKDCHTKPVHKIVQKFGGASPMAGGEYNANLILTGSLGDGVKTWDIRRKTQGKSYFYTGVKLKIHGN